MMKIFCDKSPNGEHSSKANSGIIVKPDKNGKKLYYSDELHCKYCLEDWYILSDEIMKRPVRKNVEFIIKNNPKDYKEVSHLYNTKK